MTRLDVFVFSFDSLIVHYLPRMSTFKPITLSTRYPCLAEVVEKLHNERRKGLLSISVDKLLFKEIKEKVKTFTV